MGDGRREVERMGDGRREVEKMGDGKKMKDGSEKDMGITVMLEQERNL